ncbi:MAG TPA: pirin family protein [Rhodanobacteraceae bacterium]|nr:pirin family protein [Rhodanobacteraceae bacterium]
MSNLLPNEESERCESCPDARPEILSYPARLADLGAGLTVSRSLPVRQHRLVGPWCFLDHYGPMEFAERKAMDVAPHPHIGLQTVSWLFAGEALHNDSLGFQGTVRPGELNLMTAGKGIAHSEETPPENSGRLHGLQLWVALPEAERHREPGFDHYTDLPVLEPGGGRAQVFMGELNGTASGTRAYSPLVGADLHVGGNSTLRLALDPEWEHALVIIDGDVSLDGTRLAPDALHYLGTRRSGLELVSKNSAHAVLIGGAPFGESIVMWWNFVARTADEISAAREDWEQHRRFGDVKAYRGRRLPAPPLAGRPVASR